MSHTCLLERIHAWVINLLVALEKHGIYIFHLCQLAQSLLLLKEMVEVGFELVCSIELCVVDRGLLDMTSLGSLFVLPALACLNCLLVLHRLTLGTRLEVWL